MPLFFLLAQLVAPLPVPQPPPVPVSLELSTQVIAALATAIVAILAGLTAGIVKVLTAISELRRIRVGLQQTQAAVQQTVATVGATHAAVEAAKASIEVIDTNTNGRLSLAEQAHKLLADKMAEIAAAQLSEARAQRDTLAAKLAAAEADIIRRADAAPAIPPLPRAVRESDLVR